MVYDIASQLNSEAYACDVRITLLSHSNGKFISYHTYIVRTTCVFTKWVSDLFGYTLFF